MWCPRMHIVVVVVMVMATTGHGEHNHTLPERQRLRDDLLSGYDKEILPIHPAKRLTVTMNSISIRSVDMHEETQQLRLNAWAYFEWTDQRLLWDPEDYGDIRKITFSPQDLWMPDITFYNAADAKDLPLVTKNRLVVQPSGEIIAVSPFGLGFPCVADLTYWPNDSHECHLMIGSWVHDGYEIDLKVVDDHEVTMDYFEQGLGGKNTMQWQITKSKVTREEKFYPCCEEPYVKLKLRVNIQRKAPFYDWIIKAPAACLLFLTLVVFILPPAATEKITFGGICLLLDLLFLFFTTSKIHNAPTSTPLMVQMVVVQLMVTSACVLVTALVVRASKGPFHTFPLSALHSFSLALAPALGLSSYVDQCARTRVDKYDKAMDSEMESMKGEEDKIAPQWILLAAVFDRIALTAYFFGSVVLLTRVFCEI